MKKGIIFLALLFSFEKYFSQKIPGISYFF